METRIEIQKRKTPAALIVILFVLLGGLAIWFLVHYIYPTLPGFWDLKLSAVGAIAAAIGFGCYSVVKHSKPGKPGLVVDENGITDHSNLASVGFIPWSDIIEIKKAKGDFNRMLIVVVVNNPEVYIQRSLSMAASRQVQYQQFGSPILINPVSLDYPEVQLLNLLKDHLMALE